jgi:hypothetical protein
MKSSIHGKNNEGQLRLTIKIGINTAIIVNIIVDIPAERTLLWMLMLVV